MYRFHQAVFSLSILGSSWLLMMAVHELGHAAGAAVTGGRIERVVLHPLTISRTDVSPNPQPGIVVWSGPIVGCLIPLVVLFLVPRRLAAIKNTARFFTGFCLVANGAYIACGSFDRVGDCSEMARTGTPTWTMIAFGAVAISGGLCLWHRLGSIHRFIKDPSLASPRMAYATFAALGVLVVAELLLSPR